ncbi:predicted protein [Arabidopsis lyrata subsp. lyrata]|uniref:Predicted protein n=1 Tax=Arabidopsis lyrata subsp. lyrata TaxID=81972 RepID=D7MQS5_ARALL|nr:predicted protein [Arabidopsis lyrata subsp. lyrata]
MIKSRAVKRVKPAPQRVSKFLTRKKPAPHNLREKILDLHPLRLISREPRVTRGLL